jgi:hypothetical protein
VRPHWTDFTGTIGRWRILLKRRGITIEGMGPPHEERRPLEEIIRTPDPVLVGAVEALLGGEGISVFIADRHISAIEARIAAFPLRVLVPADQADRARRLIREAGWGAELRPLA